MSFPEIRACLLAMDDSRMSLEQLKALIKAMPSDQEREALGAYLKVRGGGGQQPLDNVNSWFFR